MNLHKITSPALNAVQKTESVIVYKWQSSANVFGEIVPVYEKSKEMPARFQKDSDEHLEHQENVNENAILQKVYISDAVSGLNRVKGKQADYIYRLKDKTWWMISAVYDDFSSQGWVCVRCSLQLAKPEFING